MFFVLFARNRTIGQVILRLWKIQKTTKQYFSSTPVSIRPFMKHLKATDDIRSFVDSIDIFMFDLDGVIWEGNHVLKNASNTLSHLRSLGKQVYFITNNSTKSRRGYLSKFQSLGIEVFEHEILTSSFAAATYLSQYCALDHPHFSLLDTVNKQKKKIFVIGREGISEELKLAGIDHFGIDEFDRHTFSEDEFAREWLNERLSSQFANQVPAVLVGYDNKFNNYKLALAVSILRNNENCLLIATNTDDGLPYSNGVMLPGTGSFVSAVQTGGARSKVDAICGKPNRLLLDYVCDKFSIRDRQRVCMVGDRLETDIKMGNLGGVNTLAVLSGVVTESQLLNVKDKDEEPHYVMSHLGAIYEHLGNNDGNNEL